MATKRTKTPGKRKVQRKKAQAQESGDVGERTEQWVRVRMYRLGLGECFLLTFPRLGMPFHMLIDCGIAAGSPRADATMKRVARDIQATTAGRLDVLVVTHRHWDHISGFLQAREIFKRMAVEQVWLGWTEDPRDVAARKLEQRRNMGLARRDEAMDVVRRLGQGVRYWRGGQGPVALSGVPGARVFFLGPPTPHADLRAALRAAAAKTRATECPFDEGDRISIEEARKDARFALYFENDGNGRDAARSPVDGPEWRQIGQRSQERVPQLRLDHPQAVNDTSLVMAIELATPRGGGKVLLFPGDAQVASWWSWHEHRWPANDPKAMTSATLLQRTVLYKVSQKGTTTGTAMQVGLEMMTSPELVAMISVDEAAAKLKNWQMPAPSVLAALARKTRGRIIRADLGVPSTPGKESDLSGAEWQEFQRSVRVTNLYIDYHVNIPQLTAVEREKSEANWTAANERRVYLIDKKLAGTIRPEEEAELREIEGLLDEYMSATAPTGLGLLTELRETVERTRRSGR